MLSQLTNLRSTASIYERPLPSQALSHRSSDSPLFAGSHPLDPSSSDNPMTLPPLRASVSRSFLQSTLQHFQEAWRNFKAAAQQMSDYAIETEKMVLTNVGIEPRAVNHKDQFGTPLIFSKITPQTPPIVVQALIHQGFNVGQTNEWGRNLLMHLSSQSPQQNGLVGATVVQLLVNAGTPVDAVDDVGKTALMLAAQNGQQEAVAALIEAGANPNLQDKAGKTPLMYAAEMRPISILRNLEPNSQFDNYLRIVALLMAAGAEPNASRRESVEAVAAKKGDWVLLRHIKRWQKSRPNENEVLPQHLSKPNAVSNGDREVFTHHMIADLL